MKRKQSPKVLPIFIAVLVIAAAIAIHSFIGGFSTNDANAATHTSSAYVLDLDADSFDQVIAEGVVLVDFWATWCAPCRIQNPIIDELGKAMHEVAQITKLDVDDHGPIAARFGVRSIPTLIIFKDGEVVERFMGVQQKETLRTAIEKYL